MLEQDATTFWESWSGMSRIHDTLISIGAWFIQGIGGIRIDEQAPGFSHFILKPARVGNLTYARSTYRSIHGEIVSNWRIDNGVFRYEASVPPGTSATLHLPAQPVSVPPRGAKFLRFENNRPLYDLGPGSYVFSAKP
jgi:alpha-L-rhamnosidase